MARSKSRNAGAAAGGGAIYGLGIFGALVYFWQQADRFWEYLLAVVQGPFWPALVVSEVFEALGRRGVSDRGQCGDRRSGQYQPLVCQKALARSAVP
jgi:hypothetical protein